MADRSESQTKSVQAGLLSAGHGHTCAVDGAGSMLCWGGDYWGQIGNVGAPDERVVSPVRVNASAGRRVVSVGAGHAGSCAVLDNGSVWCLGAIATDGSGDHRMIDLPPGRRAVSTSVGLSHMCALLDDGSAICWGRSDYGDELGDGTGAILQPVAVKFPVGRRAVALSAGTFRSTCAVLDDGSVVCWGDDSFGQLGNGPGNARQPLPVAVTLPSGRTAVAISVGGWGDGAHACAVLDDGSAVCWGSDNHGQLGNGPAITGTQDSPSPVSLPAGRTAVSITAGALHTCSVLDDGSAVCWGADGQGRLGNGAATTVDQDTPSPVLVFSGETIEAISAGFTHTCALMNFGAVTCWGSDRDGQLGNGDYTDADQPDSLYSAFALGGGSVPTTVADLSLRVQGAPARLGFGQTAEVTVQVTNAGPDPATGVTVGWTALGVGVVGATSAEGSVVGSVWSPGRIESGGQATAQITLVGRLGTTFARFTAEVTGVGEPDPDSTPGNGVIGEDDRQTVTFRRPQIGPILGGGLRGGVVVNRRVSARPRSPQVTSIPRARPASIATRPTAR